MILYKVNILPRRDPDNVCAQFAHKKGNKNSLSALFSLQNLFLNFRIFNSLSLRDDKAAVLYVLAFVHKKKKKICAEPVFFYKATLKKHSFKEEEGVDARRPTGRHCQEQQNYKADSPEHIRKTLKVQKPNYSRNICERAKVFKDERDRPRALFFSQQN